MSNIPPIPIPVQPLEYMNPYHRAGRPGILTAVGVLSIVLACISILWCISGVLMSLAFAMMARVPPAAFAPPGAMVAPSGPTSPRVGGGLLVVPEEDGLGAPAQAMIVDAMQRRRSLNESRVKQLQLLLGQAGKKIFPGDATTLTPAVIRSNITESGTVPGIGEGGGSNYFIVGTGRIEVFDDHAVFRPDGSMDVVSVSGDASSNETSSVTASPGGQAGTTQLHGRSASVSVAGSRPMSVPPAVAVPVAVTMAAENVLSGLLAIFLMVAGILTLRDAPVGRRMHWIYVFIKIPLIVLAAAVSWMLWQSFMPSASPARARMIPVFTMVTTLTAVVGLLYPVALAIVLKSRVAKAYYSPVTE